MPSDMPRCRNYDEQGRPIRRGCFKKDTCRFIHPDDPAWERAPISKSSRNSFPPHSAKRDSWGAPPPVPKSRVDPLDSSVWGRTTADSSSGSGWGGFGKGDSDAGKADSSRSSGGNDKGKEATDTSSWSAPSTGNSWSSIADGEGGGWGGSGSGSGWGGSGGGWGGSGGGWGGDGGGWGASSSSDPSSAKKNADDKEDSGWGGGGWGASSSKDQSSTKNTDNKKDNGWGGGGWGASSSNDQSSTKNADNKKDKADAPKSGWAVSSSLQTSSAGSSRALFNDQSQSKKITRDSGAAVNVKDVEMAEPISKRASEKRTEVDPRRRPSIPAASALVPLAKPPLPSKAKPMVSNSSDKSSVQNKSQVSRRFSSSEGCANLYERVIKATQTVVILQMQLSRAVADDDRWKRTQNSAIYSRATPATRVKLDHQRSIYAHKVQDLKKRQNRAFQHLMELPEFPMKTSHHRDVGFDKRKIAEYTMELRDWFQSLQLDKRLVLARAEANQESDKMPPQADRIQKTAGDLRASGFWSWKDLKDVLGELESQANVVSEDVYSGAYTRDLGTRLAGFRSDLEKSRNAQHRKKLEQVSSRSKSIGVLLEKEVEKANGLYEQIRSNKNELDCLLAETEKMNQLCDQMESQLKDFETWHQEDSARIKELTEQLQTLHKYRKAKPKPAPLKVEDILPKLHPLIQDMVQKEIIPVLESIYRSCSTNNLKLKAEIAKLLEPIEASVDDVRSWVKVVEAVAAPQPVQ